MVFAFLHHDCFLIFFDILPYSFFVFRFSIGFFLAMELVEDVTCSICRTAGIPRLESRCKSKTRREQSYVCPLCPPVLLPVPSRPPSYTTPPAHPQTASQTPARLSTAWLIMTTPTKTKIQTWTPSSGSNANSRTSAPKKKISPTNTATSSPN